jgi:hypothetical protein
LLGQIAATGIFPGQTGTFFPIAKKAWKAFELTRQNSQACSEKTASLIAAAPFIAASGAVES